MATSGITSDLKKLLATELESSFDSEGANYYVGIARSNESLNLENITSQSLSDQRAIRNELQSIKVLSRHSLVVPTVEWRGNTVYNAYDDNNVNLTNFYVLNSNREVFVCIEQGLNEQGEEQLSTIEPTSTLAGNSPKSFRTSDGYLWRYMYQITPSDFSFFKNNSYFPVKKINREDNLVLNEERRQLALQDSSIAGEILRVAIVDGGTGYTSVPGLSFTGGTTGTGASFSADVSNGVITRIRVDSDAGEYLHGSGYKFATANLSYGNGSVRPVIGPLEGMSADPTKTLFANSLMMQLQLDNDETDTILTDNDFRTVVVMKDLKKRGSDSDFTGNTANVMDYFELTATSGTFVEDELVSATSGVATGKVFHYDEVSVPKRLYYYQNDSTGYGVFTSSLGISTTSGGTATISTVVQPDVDRYSGEILYINNIASVERSSTQTEDIRLVITLD